MNLKCGPPLSAVNGCPASSNDMIADADKAKATRAFGAMLRMKKLDLPALERAFNGP